MNVFHLGESPRLRLVCHDAVEVMRRLPDCSIDAVVTDPPYGFEFMNQSWDRLGGDAGMVTPGIGDRPTDWPAHGGSAFGSANPTCVTCGGRLRGATRCRCATPDWRVKGVDARHANHETSANPVLHTMQAWHLAWAREAFRVLKPGGHALVFGGARTFHRLTCALEDAGFEIRGCISTVQSQGFAKVGYVDRRGADAEQWAGWAGSLAPSWEPVVVARKPLDGTLAENLARWGVGALNVDACRTRGAGASMTNRVETPNNGVFGNFGIYGKAAGGVATGGHSLGRWPRDFALVHDDCCVVVGTAGVTANGHWPAARGAGGISTAGHAGQDDLVAARADGERVEVYACIPTCPVRLLNDSVGRRTSGRGAKSGHKRHPREGTVYGGGRGLWMSTRTVSAGSLFGDSGAVSRFFPVFYAPKAPGAERYGLCTDCDIVLDRPTLGRDHGHSHINERGQQTWQHVAYHPTVKNLGLVRWLVRLITPPCGVVLDPFVGTGTTLVAALHAGFDAIGVEQDETYCRIVAGRVQAAVDARTARGATASAVSESA